MPRPLIMRQIYAPKAVFDEALELINAGNPRAAEAVCREAVERNPKDVNMLGLLGAVLVKMRRPEQAIKAYHDCISVKPNNGETYWSLANLKTYRFSDEQLQEMENRVEDGTGATDKSEVNFLFALGKAYDDRHDYDRAWHYYERGNDKQRMLVQYDPVHTETINDAINDIESERWTVEARLSTPADSDSKWFGLVGLFYNRSKEDSLFASGNDSFAGSPGFYYIAYNLYFSNPVYVDYYGTVNPDFNPGSASLNGLPPDSWEGLNPSWPWNPTRRRQSKRLMT